MPSAIALVIVAAIALVAAKGTGCGRTGFENDPGLDKPPVKPPVKPPATPILPPEEAYQPRDLNAAFIFAVLGDYGVNSGNSVRVARLIAGWNPDFVVTTGDNNYPFGSAETIDLNIGRYYSRYIGNYIGKFGAGSQTNRFWPAPGNHDWGTGTLTAYTDYFTLPGNERYYDVVRGLVHLFAVDSAPNEPDGITADSAQAQWLRTRLAASTACFKVVYFHHPAYSSGNVHSSNFAMRWPFAAWGADVVLAGHEHVYERFLVDGIPHFTVGLGGTSLYGFAEILPESQKRFNSDFGAMRVTVNRAGMTFDFIDAAGNQVDSYTRLKNCEQPK